MRKLVLIGLLAVAPSAFAAQEARELPEFRSITSQGAYKLVVTAGQKQSVLVTADESLLAKLSTKVVDGDLVIAISETKDLKWRDKVSITVAVPQLNKFQLEGVGETTLNNVAGEEFQLNYRGVGALTVTGKVQRFVLSAEGVGTLNARDLDARDVDVSLEGIGSVKVRASESLKARVGGIGSVTYYGKPTKVTKSTEGIGRVHAAE